MTKRYVLDLFERVTKTFLQAFIGQVVLSGLDAFKALTDLSVLQKAGTAGAAAVVALLFGLVARWVGAPDSASFLPANVDPPQPAKKAAKPVKKAAKKQAGQSVVGVLVAVILIIVILKLLGVW